jgi:hypothetical protein
MSANLTATASSALKYGVAASASASKDAPCVQRQLPSRVILLRTERLHHHCDPVTWPTLVRVLPVPQQNLHLECLQSS